MDPTLKIVLTQDFFDTIEDSLKEEPVQELISTFFHPIPLGIDLGFIRLDLNITNFQLNSAQLMRRDTINLYDGLFEINFRNTSSQVQVEYQYISDPPFVADIGVIQATTLDYNFYFSLKSNFTEKEGVVLTVVNTNRSLGSFKTTYDSISDLGDLTSLMINYASGASEVLIGALTGASDFSNKLTTFFYNIYNSVPQNITLYDGPKGHYWANFEFTKDFRFTRRYVEIPMFFDVKSNVTKTTAVNNAQLSAYTYRAGEGLVLFITEYLLDNSIAYMHGTGLLNIGVVTTDPNLMVSMSTILLAFG